MLIGTGSEVQHCLDAKPLLEADGLKVRVVSMPSWTLFEALDEEAQEAVLPPTCRRWRSKRRRRSVGIAGPTTALSIDHFGASAQGDVVMEKFGYTAANVADRARQLLAELDEED